MSIVFLNCIATIMWIFANYVSIANFLKLFVKFQKWLLHLIYISVTTLDFFRLDLLTLPDFYCALKLKLL